MVVKPLLSIKSVRKETLKQVQGDIEGKDEVKNPLTLLPEGFSIFH
jgi:hypothetical protein